MVTIQPQYRKDMLTSSTATGHGLGNIFRRMGNRGRELLKTTEHWKAGKQRGKGTGEKPGVKLLRFQGTRGHQEQCFRADRGRGGRVERGWGAGGGGDHKESTDLSPGAVIIKSQQIYLQGR